MIAFQLVFKVPEKGIFVFDITSLERQEEAIKTESSCSFDNVKNVDVKN